MASLNSSYEYSDENQNFNKISTNSGQTHKNGITNLKLNQKFTQKNSILGKKHKKNKFFQIFLQSQEQIKTVKKIVEE